MSEQFFTLTPDIIFQAASDCGFVTTGHCLALNSYENRVFDLKTEEGPGIIMKFYRPGRWSRAQIEEEHSFLFELREGEIPVCAPYCFEGKQSVREICGIYYAVWPKTGGRSADEFSDTQLAMLGRLIARIHNTGDAKKSEYRRSLTGTTYARAPLEFLLQNDFIPDLLRTRYSAAVNELAQIYDTLSQGVPFHRIHGDCHQGNLLYGNDGWFFLDFDDFLTGPAVQDIWMFVPVTDREGLRQREILLEGYRQFRPFENSWLRLVEPLRALRYIHYSAWIAKRWNDPAFAAIFPHFGTHEYWQEQTEDLEKQLELIRSGKAEVQHGIREEGGEASSEEELSNKDLFWDWEE